MQNPIRLTFGRLCLILPFIFNIISCTKPHEPSVTYFIVRVDSISIPDSIPQADTLRIKLYGTVGNSGAYAFDRFEAARDSHRLNLTVWGRYTDNDYATQQIVELRGKEYQVAPLYQGRFSVNVRQPDSTFLRDSLLVF